LELVNVTGDNLQVLETAFLGNRHDVLALTMRVGKTRDFAVGESLFKLRKEKHEMSAWF
jgi:hypothetical protein